MAPPADLSQIGKDAFDLVDRFYGRKSRQDPQPHYVILWANDVPMASQPLRQNYPYGILNPNPNTNTNPHERRQPIGFQDLDQVHLGHGMVQENGVMDSTRLAKISRGVTKLEVRLVN